MLIWESFSKGVEDLEMRTEFEFSLLNNTSVLDTSTVEKVIKWIKEIIYQKIKEKTDDYNKGPPPPTITKTLDYISSEMPIIGEMIPKINSTSDKTNTHK